MAITAGRVLHQRYQLTERVAVGGMGEVWQAHDRTLDRVVAVKLLRDDLHGNQTALARLRAEARNGGGLSHPNLATLLDYGERDGGGFLVMEYVAGEALSAVLARERTLPVREVLRILAQCAAGLHAAHVAGVVHRDVKPSNILLTPEGTAKLTDFGISLGAGQPTLTAAGMVMGTAQYLPPEVALGKKASPAGDVYALGVVAYEALAGHRPYTGRSQVEIAFAHVEEALPPLPGHLPGPVRDLLEAMLAKDPTARPRSAAAVARAAEELLSGEDVSPAASVPGAGPPATVVAAPATDDQTPRVGTATDSHTAHASPATAHRASRDPGPAAPRPAPASGLPSRRAVHRPAARRRWRRPSWRELAADRRWLTALGIGVTITIVLIVVLIGTLALGNGQALTGADLHLT